MQFLSLSLVGDQRLGLLYLMSIKEDLSKISFNSENRREILIIFVCIVIISFFALEVSPPPLVLSQIEMEEAVILILHHV